MNTNNLLRTCCLALLLSTSLTTAETLGTPGSQTAQVFSQATPATDKNTLHYWLSVPTKETKEPWPLLLFLHGSGERGTNLEAVKKHGPPGLLKKNPALAQCLLISPQCPAEQWWDVKLVKALVDDVISKLPVDPHRRYVTGLSMGGFGTWSLLEEYPTFWAAAVPICGGSRTPQAAGTYKDVPIWMFHGAKDAAVAVTASEEMFAALEAAGGHPKKTIYPDIGHESWIPAYNDVELWKWLFAQRQP